jgi:hypothetical protein
MPTRAELRGPYVKGLGPHNLDPVFNTSGWFVWATPEESKRGWCFFFNDGAEDQFASVYRSSGSPRAFGVRSFFRES